jgi:Cu-Zn family superoxide dismutase
MSTARATVALLVGASTVPWLPGRAAEPAAGGIQQGGGTTVRFQNLENAPIGEAVLRGTPNGIVATVTLHDLPPGEHGFHIHETGKCLPPFESAGGHFDPTGRPHGFAAEGGPHVGDLPNLVVPASGRVSFQVFVPEATLDEGGPATLLDADGSAFVVHAGADDHHTDPAGHSGGRIACGIVVSKEEKQ